MPENRFWLSTFLLSGTIIGIGMFALPFVFSRAGFLVGTIELVVLTGVTLVMNLFYGEVILRTPEKHLLPGLSRLYLGRWGWIEVLSAFFGFSGALFVYVLLGGVFVANLAGIDVGLGRFLFFAAGALLVLVNLKLESKVNYALTVILVLFILILSGLAFAHFSASNLSGVNIEHVFLPYGVILFSLAGGVVIPEMAALLGDQKKLFRKSLVVGTVVPALVYFVFTLSVVGATGSATSSEALLGLLPLVGQPVFVLGNAIGFLALFTSFMMFGFTFEDVLRSDFGIRKVPAWLFFVAVTGLLFLLPVRDYVTVLNVLGAVAVGIDSIFILWLYHRAKNAGRRTPEYALGVPLWAIAIFGVLFFAGLAIPFL